MSSQLPAASTGHAAAIAAEAWRDLQLVQAEHDRHFHPTSIDMARLNQLRRT